MSDDQRVTVAIRVRPKIESATNATQQAERFQPEAVTKVSEDTVRISESKGKDVKSVSFTYDFIFDRDSTQEELYDDTTQASIDGALQGHHATIMTYGQTGSGKTYTVLGAVKANPLATDVVTADTGLFIRALRDLLTYAERRSKDLHVVIGLSVVEIYLDNIRDLLAKDSGKGIKPVIDNDHVQLPDLTVQQVHNLRDAVDVYKVATGKRVARATEANDASSRSHALFFIEIFQIPKAQPSASSPAAPLGDAPEEEEEAPTLEVLIAAKERMMASAKLRAAGGGNRVPLPGTKETALYSKIVLTDLAGSEKLKHSNATGQGFEEMKEINKSLTALGNVVHALFSGQKHIPYRDTRLTILLRSTFSAPDARVVLIANVAPTQLTFDETQSTLFFANKVKAMNSTKSGAQGSDLKAEMEYLNTLRITEEQFADLRIVKESHNFSPMISCGVLPRSDAGARRLRLNLNGFATKAGSPTSAASPTASPQPQKKFDPSKHPKWAEAQRLLEARAKVAADARSSDKDDLVQRAQEEVYVVMTNEYRENRKKVEDAYKAEAELAAGGKDLLKKEDASQLSDIQKFEAEVDALTKLHVQLDTKKDTSKIKIEQQQGELVVVKEKLDACIKAYMEQNSEEENAWKKWEANLKDEDHIWTGQQSVVEQCKQVENDMNTYVDALGVSHAVYRHGVKLRHDCDMIDFRAELKDMLVDRSYEVYLVQYRKRAQQEAEYREKMRKEAKEAEGHASPPPPGMRPAPKARPKKSTAGEQHVDPSSPRPDSGAGGDDEVVKKTAVPKKPSGGPPRKPPSLFDVPSLLTNIIEYVECGASLLKHGRSGKPHYRFFYVFREVPHGEAPLVNSAECNNYLCWVEEEPLKLKLTSNAINLNHIRGVSLGKCSAVFDRSFKPRGGVQDTEFYSSFTLKYQGDGAGATERTMDIVCEMTSELESWVIGLCYLCRVNPVFDRPMDITSEASLATMPSLEQVETEAEKELVSVWHVPPKLWVSIIQKLAQIAERRRMRKAMITPGELCAIAQLDIFRSTAMWRLLVDQALIMKPRFMGRSYLEFDIDFVDGKPSRPAPLPPSGPPPPSNNMSSDAPIPPSGPPPHKNPPSGPPPAATAGGGEVNRDLSPSMASKPKMSSKPKSGTDIPPPPQTAPTPKNGDSASPPRTTPKAPPPKMSANRGDASSPKAPVRPPPKSAPKTMPKGSPRAAQ